MPIFAALLLSINTMAPFGPARVMPFAGGKNAAFSLEFDDSMTSQIDNVLPLLAKYRFAATFYINPGRNDYRPEIWEKTVPAAGHELGDHTMHHADTVGATQAAIEIGGVAKIIERVHGRPLLTPFGIPGGVKWEVSKDDFERILRENRLFLPGRDDFYQDGGGDIVGFPRIALEKGIWRKLGFHGVGGQWLSTSVESLARLFDFLYAHRSELWIAPTGTVWRYAREREAVERIEIQSRGDGGFEAIPHFDRSKLVPFELYDVPLTVRVPVPTSWKAARVRGPFRPIPAPIVGTAVQFDVLPGTGIVYVERADSKAKP